MDARAGIIESIKTEVRKHNAEGFFREPLVGFSFAQDPLYQNIREYAGSHHALPADILPGVKTIVSFFIPLSAEVIDCHRKSDQVPEKYALSYLSANQLINHISRQLTEDFTSRGIGAQMVRSTHTYDPKILKAAWSHRSAAYIAGMGSFGLNRMLITPKGCAGRFGTVFLELELAPDIRQPIQRCLYYKDGSCRFCCRRCPTKALTEHGFDRFRCNEELLRVDAGFPHLETCDVCGKCLLGPCAILPD